ncbi:PAS domain S-box protein [Humidesulfovibrio sp.]
MRIPALIALVAVLVFAEPYLLESRAQGSAPLALTEQERAWLDENRSSIRLTYDVAFPPIEFQDAQGRYAGLGADIVARIESMLGVTFEKHPTSDWNAFLKDLESGASHLNAGMASTPEREAYAACTTPYIKLPLVIITATKNFGGQPVDWKELKGRRVAVVSGYMTESFVRQHGGGQFTVVPVGSVLEGLRGVSFGVVDAFVDNLATSSFYIERDALTNLRVAGSVEAVFPMSICVSRKYPLLLSAVQKALAAIPEEDIERSRKSWISLGGEGMLSRETLQAIKAAGLFAVLLLLGLIAISYFLKRRLDDKVRTLRLAQQELLDQTQRLALATEASSAGAWEVFPATGRTIVSEQWYAMLGLVPDVGEFSLDGWMALLHPDDRAGVRSGFAAYCDSGGHGGFEAEFRMRHADGSWRWVLGKGRCIEWDAEGRVARVIGLNMDIQKFRGVQEELRRSEALVKAAFDQTFQLCALLDVNGVVVKFNKSAQIFTGVSSDDAMGRPFWECPCWEDAASAETMLRQAIGIVFGGGVFRREVANLGANGVPAVVDFSLSPLTEADGAVHFLIAEGRDITETRRAEAALKASEEKYRAIFTNSPVGIFRSTFAGVVEEVNVALARMHGYTTPEAMLTDSRHLGIAAFLGVDDREALLRALLASPKGVRLEIALKRGNGEVFPAIVSASLQHDAEGVPSYIDGAVEDITARKLGEEALRAKTALLEAQVNATIDGILVVDEQGRRALMNRRIVDLFHVPQEVLESDDDKALLQHVLGLVRDPESFLEKVRHLYRHPYEVSRDEIAFADGRQFDRHSGPVLGKDGTLYGRIWTFRDITDSKQLEARLGNQLAFQQALLDTLPYAVFYKGPDSRFLGFNKAYEESFGVRREDLIGKRVLDLEYLPMEQRIAFQAEDEAIIASGGQSHREVAIAFADGLSHQSLYSVTGFRQADGSPGGLIGVIVDISERKEAEERLRQSEERFSRIFEMAPESISFVRLRDRVVIATNAAFELITGHAQGAAIGRTVDDLELWEEPQAQAEFLGKLSEEGHVSSFEFLLRREDGEVRRAVNSAQLVSLSGERCYISVMHDITDERRMQELLIQSEKMMSVGSLAAGIAHEINNPLGIVHQAVQNLIRRTSPDQRKNLETAAGIGLDMDLLQQYVRSRKLDVFLLDIQAAALRASGIIRNMLNFSRRSESKRSICNLRRIIEQSVFLASSDYDLKKAYDFKRIEIVLDLDEHYLPCGCTETELEQVLLNLLRNAAQAMAMAQPPTPNPRIEIRLRAQEDGVRIEVADNGPGIAPQALHKVFEPFYTTKPPGVGTGLGLSVSYFIITKGHRGRMWVASTPGSGTSFFIELPADERGAQDD